MFLLCYITCYVMLYNIKYVITCEKYVITRVMLCHITKYVIT